MNDTTLFLTVVISIVLTNIVLLMKLRSMDRQLHSARRREIHADIRAAHYFRLYRIYYNSYWKTCGINVEDQELTNDVDTKVFG